MTWRTETGYGRGAFRMQPSGISSGTVPGEAQLFGISGATTTLMPKQE
jgi:ribosomal protein S12 methylthiotransferase accessory factor YcaO